MKIYYCGLNASTLFFNDTGVIVILDKITRVPFPETINMEIGWNYILLLQNEDLFISGILDTKQEESPKKLTIPDESSGRIKFALAGKENVTILTTKNNLWQYNLYEKIWKKVNKFISICEDTDEEYIVKIDGERSVVALTNFGRVFNIPVVVEMENRIKFIDVACGFDHTILLAENGDIYSMGLGTRGQLGHGDLEDCDNPKIIEALAGIKVSQISAAGWHSAVITAEGDLYTWGWNTFGELGLLNSEKQVIPLPTVVDFENEEKIIFETNVKRVQCGNNFTICLLADGTFWGCGSNKFGQLGISIEKLTESKKFIQLDVNEYLDTKFIKDFKCKEWGFCLICE
ncbi:uncharacterized protein LOC127279187 [Leptopilina boulardi]|uniref:uncharacterized protein LOC127279187 n=1 Tax=Leptopilina boulardi TaxID=63433 RepID=UPI0021F5A075|nr:uncharacterized protein LOC127279187 [Leptopilina boulardi]